MLRSVALKADIESQHLAFEAAFASARPFLSFDEPRAITMFDVGLTPPRMRIMGNSPPLAGPESEAEMNALFAAEYTIVRTILARLDAMMQMQ
jgi:hypothetical protein